MKRPICYGTFFRIGPQGQAENDCQTCKYLESCGESDTDTERIQKEPGLLRIGLGVLLAAISGLLVLIAVTNFSHNLFGLGLLFTGFSLLILGVAIVTIRWRNDQ